MYLLLVPLSAAFSLSGSAWPPEAMPVEIHWTGEQEGLTQEEVQATVEAAAAVWNEAGACAFAFEVVDDPDPEDADVMIYFGDPTGVVVPGVAIVIYYGMRQDASFESNGRSFTVMAPLEMVVSAGPVYADADGDGTDDCEATVALEGGLAHQFGHALGLEESCKQGEECEDQAAIDAVMYWSSEICDDTVLSSDDIAGVQAIYGGGKVAFSCGPDPLDGLIVECTSEGSSAGQELGTWDFGDGTTTTGSSVGHTYATEGSYAVTLCVEQLACGTTPCETQTVVVTKGTVSPVEKEEEAVEAGCGCISTHQEGTPGAAWLLLGLAWRRRKKEKKGG